MNFLIVSLQPLFILHSLNFVSELLLLFFFFLLFMLFLCFFNEHSLTLFLYFFVVFFPLFGFVNNRHALDTYRPVVLSSLVNFSFLLLGDLAA